MLDRVQTGQAVEKSRNCTGPFTALLGVIARLDASSSSAPTVNEFDSAVNTTNDAYSMATETYHTIRADTYQLGTVVDYHAVSAFLRCIARHCPSGSVERENAARTAYEDAEGAHVVNHPLVVRDLCAVLGEAKVRELYPKLLLRSSQQHSSSARRNTSSKRR